MFVASVLACNELRKLSLVGLIYEGIWSCLLNVTSDG